MLAVKIDLLRIKGDLMIPVELKLLSIESAFKSLCMLPVKLNLLSIQGALDSFSQSFPEGFVMLRFEFKFLSYQSLLNSFVIFLFELKLLAFRASSRFFSSATF
jgi:hypothetical protein